MDITKYIKLLEKYKSISVLLGLSEDTKLLNELVEMLIVKNENGLKEDSSLMPKKSKYGEKEFNKMINNYDNHHRLDLEQYDVNTLIISNKDNLIELWHTLKNEEQEQFSIFELNIILFLISNQYNKYQKSDKRKIISLISSVVKSKRMENSYNNIKV